VIPEIPQWAQLTLVTPELWLIGAMCAVILVPFIRRDQVGLYTVTAAAGLTFALLATSKTLTHLESFGPLFSGMLTVDLFSQFFKLLLIGFALLVLGQWWYTSRDQTHIYDVPDFLCLLLGAALGMALMASASNLLMIFLAIEMASLPSYALAGFRKKLRAGSEGALKYVIFGSASSAVMLYGMSLIYGSCGTLNLQDITASAAIGITPLMAIGLAAMFAGFAFKLSAVPMHFWCPDVFQAAPIEVTTFLSVASKGAAICLLMRVLHLFGLSLNNLPTEVADTAVFGPLVVGVAILGGVTATWGNLVALHQTNIKRLLAYSSIAHAGYMIMAASMLAVSGVGHEKIIGAIYFYLFVYLFMNLGAFTVVALVSQATGGEQLQDYTGLMRRSPILAVLLTIFLLSLFGFPGLGGFNGKILLMRSMFQAGPAGFVLIVVLLINTLFSLYYYLRPIYYMAFVTDTEIRPNLFPRGGAMGILIVCALMVVWTGVNPDPVNGITQDYAQLASRPINPRNPVVRQATMPETSIPLAAIDAMPSSGSSSGY